MTSTSATPPAPPSARPRRLLLWAVAVCVAVGSAVLGKNRIVEWGVRWALRTWEVPLQFESLDVALGEGSVTVWGGQWTSAEGGPAVQADTLQLRRIRWNNGRLHVKHIHLGSVALTGAWNSSQASDGGWPERLQSVQLDLVTWSALSWYSDSTSVAAKSGQLVQVRAEQDRVELGSLNLSGAWGSSPSLPDTLHLGPSHLSGRWSPRSWHAQSTGLNLPGVRFQGALSWPEREGNGSLTLAWDLLTPWAEALDVLPLVQDLELMGSQTSAAWNLGTSDWSVSLSGPDWLAAEATGTRDSWNATVHANGMPAAFRSSFPASRLTWQAQGTAAACSWELKGDTSVRVTGAVRSADSWWEALPSSLPVADVLIDVERWGPWISAPADRVTAAIRHVSNQTTRIDVAQPQAPLPWNLSGSWDNSKVVFRGEVLHLPAPSGDTLDLTTWGTAALSEGRDALVWHAKATASIFPDTLLWNGRSQTDLSSWSSQIQGLGMDAGVKGKESPAQWVQAATRAVRREPVIWPWLEATAHFQPDNPVLSLLVPQLRLTSEAKVKWFSNSRGLEGQINLPKWSLGELELDSTHVTLKGDREILFANLSAETANDPTSGSPRLWAIDLQADTAWYANLTLGWDDGNVVEWALEASPGERLDAPWRWTLHNGSVPVGSDRFDLAETPLVWTSPISRPLPPSWKLEGELGSMVFHATDAPNGVQSVSFFGHFPDLASVAKRAHPDLQVERVVASGSVEWNPLGNDDVVASLECEASGLAFDSFDFPRTNLSLAYRKGLVFAELGARNEESQTAFTADGAFQVSSMAIPRMELELTNLPLEWFSTWVDSSTAVLEGAMDAQIRMSGKLANPRIRGLGYLDTLTAFVPSLGTSFHGRGGFEFNRDELVLNDFVVADEQGLKATVFGALLHDNFEDWNLDVSVMEAPVGMKIMDLPATPNAPVFGSLYGGGTLDVFYWNDQITLTGDVVADAPSDFKISLVTDDDTGWGELVQFATPQVAEVDSLEAAGDNSTELGVVLNLDIEARPGARVTLVIDDENNANIVGYTEGNIKLVLEDWDRMTLQGQLTVVEGQYDFALGSFLRKTFEARPGATLRWDGDPYQGEMQLDAVYRTRANVQPLLGSASNSGMRKENIDVVLHLDGPMLQPNIAFDLEAPRADRLVQEALASAVTDESERTNQAIALLSLQEFLPQQFSTLELGSSGLQEYSIDMITSSLSRFLSRINDDVEVGVSYDPQNALSTTELANQDALQLALKASFLEDKLEVEGSLGSSVANQDALSEARLQNVRVLYHLNEEKGLQLTGFSESQTSATQSANTTSQGVGIRWHRAFNWEWPWRQAKGSED
jgi:hypothetical protein